MSEVYVASTLGILGGLFSRRKKPKALSFPGVEKVMQFMNMLDLERTDQLEAEVCKQENLQAELRLSKANVVATKRQLGVLDREIGMLKEKLRFFERTGSPKDESRAPKRESPQAPKRSFSPSETESAPAQRSSPSEPEKPASATFKSLRA